MEDYNTMCQTWRLPGPGLFTKDSTTQCCKWSQYRGRYHKQECCDIWTDISENCCLNDVKSYSCNMSIYIHTYIYTYIYIYTFILRHVKCVKINNKWPNIWSPDLSIPSPNYLSINAHLSICAFCSYLLVTNKHVYWTVEVALTGSGHLCNYNSNM